MICLENNYFMALVGFFLGVSVMYLYKLILIDIKELKVKRTKWNVKKKN